MLTNDVDGIFNATDILPSSVVSQKDAKEGVTTYTYDEVNRKTTVVDALGNAVVHFHDELLRLIA